MSSEPNNQPTVARSIFSITLFVFLAIGVSFMTFNLIVALINKFA